MDLFPDGSLLLVDAPGYLPGYLNLLSRVSGNLPQYIYLAGDAFHDRRILTGEREVVEWVDALYMLIVTRRWKLSRGYASRFLCLVFRGIISA